jgi:hypothetical protein
MGMRRFAQRDTNEGPIVDALRAAGASVTKISQDGVPDLLVGYRGHDRLLEVKHLTVTGKTLRQTSQGQRPDARGLTPCQQKWWATWLGAPPSIVRTPDEALAVLRQIDESIRG